MKKITLCFLFLCLSMLFLNIIPDAVYAYDMHIAHSFAGADGASPNGDLIQDGNCFYGMTLAGGTSNKGAIFKIDMTVPAAPVYTILHSFAGAPGDGEGPYDSLILSGTTLYGMTKAGGTSEYGTIFKIDMTDPEDPEYTILHSFDGTDGDGKFPYGSLIFSADKNTLYGMTYLGGTDEYGVVFKIDTDGSNFDLLYSFAENDGTHPLGSLVLSPDETTLYGMTSDGGTSEYGTIFSIPAAGGDITILHSFDGTTDGECPQRSLILSEGTLYGMTCLGEGDDDYGVVFKIDTDCMDATATATVVDGAITGINVIGGGSGYTSTPDVIITDADGSGATATATVVDGAITGINVTGGGHGYSDTPVITFINGGIITILHSFTDEPGDGGSPEGSLILSGTTLYGMTRYAGSDPGAIFKIETGGSGFTILHSFAGTPNDGAGPRGSLILSGTTLYGMTYLGGASDKGVLFYLTPGSAPTGNVIFFGTNF